MRRGYEGGVAKKLCITQAEEAKPKPEATVAAEGTSDNDSDEEKKTRRAKNTRSSARIKSNQRYVPSSTAFDLDLPNYILLIGLTILRGDKRTNTIALEEMQMRPPSPQTTRKVGVLYLVFNKDIIVKFKKKCIFENKYVGLTPFITKHL